MKKGGPVQLDYDDWAVFDDPISLSYLSKTGQNQYAAAVPIDAALRGSVTAADVAMSAILATKRSAVFHIWKSRMPNTSPKKNDVIVEVASGAKWTVETAQVMDQGNRHRLTCTLER